MSSMVNKLLAIPADLPPETKKVHLPRLGLTVTLREISYDALQSCRNGADAHFHYLLKSAVEPDFKDAAWYREKMGCPTPVDAMKKLLRPGEVERLCRVADTLNGYGADSVSVLELSAENLSNAAVDAVLEELEKNGESALTSM